MKTTPTLIPGLRSPYEQVGGLFHFGRMLDKIRLHHAGKLPADWVAAKGSDKGFDGRCCRLLRVAHSDLEKETLKGGTDESLLEWCFSQGRKPGEDEIEHWNAFLMKMGWRDSYIERLHFRLNEVGLPIGSVLTMFDFIDLDEGRPPRFK
jgi:hypothetical protein